MTQMKVWTYIKSLKSRPSIQQHRDAVENDIDAITCGNATDTAITSQLCFSNAANTIHSDTDADARTPIFADARDIFYLPQPDPQPTKHSKVQFLRYASNVDALMEAFNYHVPIFSTAASCLPHQDMWLPCEPAEQIEIPEKTFLDRNEYLFHNPHDMRVSFPNTRRAAESLENSSWVEERDKHVLRGYLQEPLNIILHSDCPHIAPHIVITPDEETFGDYYTPWNNQTPPQWPGLLMVPPPPRDFNIEGLHPPALPHVIHELRISCPDNNTGVDGGPRGGEPTRFPDTPKRVFIYSQFSSFAERTANERLILYHVVKAVQKHQCKAAVYAASIRAAEFCRRYKTPESLASIEKPFVWTDPAEPLLSSSKRMLGTILLESACPFRAPHIVINTPPVQNPWIPWYNAVNDPQDGRYLTVPSPRVNYINIDEEEDEETLRVASPAISSKFFLASDDGEEVDNYADSEGEEESADHVDSPPSSRPGSPGPDTPTDDSESASMRSFFQSRYSSFVIDEDDEDERALALAIAKNAVEEFYQSAPLLRVSLPVIEEEGVVVDRAGFLPLPSPVQMVDTTDDGSLPPLDDWYLNIASRTMGPVVSVA